jgi:hypothetical protein
MAFVIVRFLEINMSKRLRSVFAVLLLAFSIHAMAQQAVPVDPAPIRHLEYPPEFTAEQILNGNLGRPPSPPPFPVTFDDEGFAKDRLFHVPPIGVHPRILFGPQDLPGIRKRLANTASGRQMLAFSRKQLADGIDKPGTWENMLYQYLLKGDIGAFSKLYRTQDAPIVSGNANVTGAMKPATKWHHRDPFAMGLEVKAFVCLLDDDKAEGARLGTVLAAYALYFKPRIEQAAAGPYGDNWWRSMRAAVDGWPHLPYAYDFDYNFMTPEQQKTVRGVLSLITKGRYTLGMDLPPHWRNWNFLGLSFYECLFSLAIEGEEGYDPRIYKRTLEVVRDYLAYAINPSGMAHESVGYHSAGMTHTSFVMIAMANRGDNFFTQSHYRAQLDQWYLQTMQPYGGEWLSDGDLQTFPPGTEPLMVAKYFYPKDAKLDFVFQNLPEVRHGSFAIDLSIVETMITASDPDRDASGKLIDYKAGAAFHLPDTYADEHRGVVITRNEWTPDAMYLNFECHPDTTFASHDHSDRGRFVLAALGRNWAWEYSRVHETGGISSVLIDDAGQGFFPTYAKWLGMTDTDGATFAGCDASYAYDWKWFKESGMWPDDDPRLKTQTYSTLRSHVPLLDKSITEYDPSPNVVAYYKDYLAGNPRMWDEDSWVVRQPNNPVLYAFRSAGLVRGEHSYALVVDDIKKDSSPHEFKWLMPMQDDLVLQKQSHHDSVHDIILAEKNGNRRLLLRVFDGPDASGEAVAEHLGEDYKLQNNPTQHVLVYRLTIPEKATTYASKVLLYAFHEGDPLPATTWNSATGKATVRWSGEEDDELDFKTGADGRTGVVVLREGKQIAVTP